MDQARLSITVVEPSGTLDRIHAYWLWDGQGEGHMTLTCWGCAWTCYFGSMPADTVQEFFVKADTGYLVNKLGITPTLKQSKKHEQYLGRIIEAVKTKLREGN
jgi:uncharacterized metal-binding protein